MGSLAVDQAFAQNTRLRLTGWGGNFGNSQVVHFDDGYDESGAALTFTVRNMTGAANRLTNVYIVATGATIGSKPISDVVWRRNDLGVWNPLTTSQVLVESQTIAGVGTEWSNSIWFRVLYPWSSSPPEALAANVQLVLEVLPP
jgi:hypothetical protein